MRDFDSSSLAAELSHVYLTLLLKCFTVIGLNPIVGWCLERELTLVRLNYEWQDYLDSLMGRFSPDFHTRLARALSMIIIFANGF